MSTLKYPRMFAPITLAGTTFRNRIFASPISGRNFDAAGRPDADCVAFYERKASGGAASVCVGDCIVDCENGLFGEPMLDLSDESQLMIKALNRLARQVSRHGAVASLELNHAGLYANASRMRGAKIYAPSDGVTAQGLPYYEMPEERILETVARFARAAAYAKRCGFGMVTIHGGHGWLLSQFMSPKVNARRDKWGGSVENRMRFPVMVCDAVKAAVGRGFPVEIRISGSEVTPLGYDLDEGIAIAKALDGHADLIHVSAGHHEHSEVFCVTHPGVFSEDSANVQYAAAIKQAVKNPVATVGAHSDPELLEEILASGKADVIEMARALLADPDLPRKLRRGEPDSVCPCLRCLQCFSGLITGGTIYCAVNPEIGNEREYKTLPKTEVPKRVLVAGGGVAGMRAAITAAESGHEVTLAEASGSLGGTLRCEENVPFKRKIKAYIDYQKRRIAALPIDVRLNSRQTPESARELKPDAIIAAFGARSSLPPIPGIALAVPAERVYASPALAAGETVILGGGLVGQELAIFLAGLGKSVTIAEMAPALNSAGNILHQFALDGEIKRLGIKVFTSARVVEITDGGVRTETAGGTVTLAARTVVAALGQTALTADAYALSGCAAEFYAVGDCVAPANIMAASAQAEAVARIL
ncbi:MAG: NAD(P)/FAD-dependent oxidoreductase [Oscillospiraceae bacterium]|jgi:2,4-dienoyl-CoA reductase-like NADH-dependent reductase (Old Yellow Enzyme family)/pyruvate/2-oxoglutarate dehydrogenase complex dihydrolipoamide dehydrogenase (E3) component|nr:NAD(P)/FAD-dependent oxidoreductase [Oscillospiraceae bacterium]